MESESDYQNFTCAYCTEEKIDFVFWDEKGNKFCSPLCRRKFSEERKAAVEALEADIPDSVSWPAG